MSRVEEIVSLERHINASPETVYSFFSSGERWAQWQGVEATVELKPGGMLRISMVGGEIALGRILEVERDRRLVFTWGWDAPDHPVPPGSSTVEIELVPKDGGTLLRLTHTGLPPAFVDHHRQGWKLFTGRLQMVATGGAVEPEA